ncbi:hypothetical protein UFOVP703_36 [uncultured Caudovirales phage]|uniref:Uncharacterized protein n=1 Tax=uncultured Caudovirales phage TaxID=2100421 RepID=A0A6J5NPD5_9CAUD|nr:hypothetical protein UFOVP703_36 [uncultured Caudovirales phage]
MRILAALLDCTESDAIDLMQTRDDVLTASWERGDAPELAAKAVDRATHPADPGTQPSEAAESLAMARAYANNAGALIVPLTLAELAALLRCVSSVTDDLGIADYLDAGDDPAGELALLDSATRIMATTLKEAEAGGVGDPPARGAVPTDATLRRQLANAWIGRRKAQGWKPGSATHAKHALEFLIGARAALELVGRCEIAPEMLLVAVSIGRDPVDLMTGGEG